MSAFSVPFDFEEEDKSTIRGTLELDDPVPYQPHFQTAGYYRTARIESEGCGELDVVLYHNDATSKFIYLHEETVDPHLMDLIGYTPDQRNKNQRIILPGQLCMGANRSRLIDHAVGDLFSAPLIKEKITAYKQQNLAVFPIAREGLKYQVSEAIFENYGYYCDEIMLDAHHVFDRSVPVYNRKVEMTLFKDKDLDQHQRENICIAFIADSIASGLVMKETIERVKERFDHIELVEVIAPLATIRGLCRIARARCSQGTRVRVHVFETLLNALPPDFYYSAHFNIPEFHIRPDLEASYREWWGQDHQGNWIADTACAGYGWSEVFYSPRKQIEMINSQLEARHQTSIAEIVRRNVEKANN